MPGEGAHEAGKNHRLLSPKSALSVTNNVLSAVLGTAALVLIAKNMGPSVMGVLGFSMAAIGLLSFLSDFGVGSIHSMHIRRGEDVGKCVGAYAVIKLVLLGVFGIVTFILIKLWESGSLGGEMPQSYIVTDSLQVFLVYYLLLGLSQISTHTFDALGSDAKVHVTSLLEVVVRVSFISYVATTSLGVSPSGPALLASGYTAGIISATLLAALFIRRVKISRPDAQILRKYINTQTPVFVVSMIIILDLYLDKAVVGYFWGDYEVGLYFGVQKMAIFVGVFSLSVATLILPSVTTYFLRRDTAAGWDIVNQAERYVSLIVIPTAAFYLVYGADILRVFLTDEFAGAVNTMDLLVVSSAVVALVLPLRSAIAGTGRPTTLFLVGVGGLLVQLVTMLLLVPDELLGLKMAGLKGLGAAVALLVSSVYYFFVLRYLAWRTARIVANSRSFKHLVSAVVMIGAMYVVDWLLVPAVDWLALILLAVVGAFVYAVVSYVIGELEPSDYRYFRALLNPQDQLQYVFNELLGKRSQ